MKDADIKWLSTLPAGIESTYSTFILFRYANNSAMQFYLGWSPEKASYHFNSKVLKARSNFEIAEEGTDAVAVHGVFGPLGDCSLQFGDSPVQNANSDIEIKWINVVEGVVEDKKGKLLTIMHFNGGQSIQLYLNHNKEGAESLMKEFLQARPQAQALNEGGTVFAYQMPFSEDGRLWVSSDKGQMNRLADLLQAGPRPGEAGKDFLQRVIGKHHPLYGKYLRKMSKRA